MPFFFLHLSSAIYIHLPQFRLKSNIVNFDGGVNPTKKYITSLVSQRSVTKMQMKQAICFFLPVSAECGIGKIY